MGTEWPEPSLAVVVLHLLDLLEHRLGVDETHGLDHLGAAACSVGGGGGGRVGGGGGRGGGGGICMCA